MNRIFLLLIFIQISIKSLNAQIDYRQEELKNNIQFFRKATISFGIDTVMTFPEFKGKNVTKRIFLTVGTGVLFYFNYQDKFIPCVITAKHVLRDTLNGWNPRSLKLRFVQDDTLPIDKYFGENYPLYGDLNLPIWMEHPDSTVDLAVFILDPTKKTTQNLKGIIPYSFILKDEEYFEGKEIFVLGYPSAVGLDLLNKAVLRKGIISWVATDIQKTGNSILIDCDIFPGNSGGPVFSSSKNSGYILSDTILNTPKFYGIVSQRRFSYNKVISNGRILTDPSGRPILSMESVGIGVIVTAKKVLELLNHLQTDFSKWAKQEEENEIKKNN